jgi:hypothetical protein
LSLAIRILGGEESGKLDKRARRRLPRGVHSNVRLTVPRRLFAKALWYYGRRLRGDGAILRRGLAVDWMVAQELPAEHVAQANRSISKNLGKVALVAVPGSPIAVRPPGFSTGGLP